MSQRFGSVRFGLSRNRAHCYDSEGEGAGAGLPPPVQAKMNVKMKVQVQREGKVMATTPVLPRFLHLLLFLGGLLLLCPHGTFQAVHGALHNVTVEDEEVDGRRSLYPSCVDWDDGRPGLGGGGHFLVGSAASPFLLSISDAGVMQKHLLNVESDHGCSLSILGIKIDPRQNRVLAVLHSFDGSCAPFDALAAYDLSSKRRIFLAVLHNVSAAGSYDSRPIAHHVCIDHHGNAYVTNSAYNFVWKVDSNGMPSVFLSSPLFLSHLPVVDNPAAQEEHPHSPASHLPVVDNPAAQEEHPHSPASPHHMGLNGIVYAPPGYLLLGQSNSGMLFRINLHGSDALIIECGQLFPGINGIDLRSDGTLVLVSSKTIWVLKSQDSWNTAHVVDTLPNMAPSDGALAVDITFREGQQPYILHSYVHELFAGKEVERKAFFIQEVQFPSDQDDAIWIIVGIIILVIFIFLWRFQMNYFFKQYTKKRV